MYHSFSICYFLFILGSIIKNKQLYWRYCWLHLRTAVANMICVYMYVLLTCNFWKKRYAQKIYLFINRCSHIHESDIWWIIDYFEAILPHFTIFIHCWKPMVSLAEAYWPYSLIIFIFYELFSINQWESRTLQYLEV